MRYWITALLLLSLACTKREAPTPAASEPATESDAPSAPSGASPESAERKLESPLNKLELQVLEPGKEPRSAVRWRFKPGVEQRLSLELQTRIEGILGGLLKVSRPGPVVRYQLTLKAKDVGPDGTARIVFTIDEARIGAGLDVLPKKTTEPLGRGLSTLEQGTGSYSVSTRGQVENIELTLPPDAPRKARDLADELTWALYQLIKPFPEEPVGEGATWTVDRGLRQGGILIDDVSTVQIAKLRESKVEVKVGIDQTAAGQWFEQPGGQEGKAVELASMRGEGGGEASYDLASLGPSSVQLETKAEKIVLEPQSRQASNQVFTTRTLTVNAK